MNIIKNYNRIRREWTTPLYQKYLFNEIDYSWERDFPINYQNKEKGSKKSKFELEFLLSQEELQKNNRFTESKLTTPKFVIIIEFGPDNILNLKVSKQRTSKLNKNAKIVSKFVSDNLVFNYIPSIRTES